MAVVLFWPLTPAIFMSFFSYVFSSSSLLHTTLVTFGCSSIWGLLLLEARYFRGAKDDIKKLVRLRSLPATWIAFSVLDPVTDISQLFVAYVIPLLLQSAFYQSTKHRKRARFFTLQFLLFSCK